MRAAERPLIGERPALDLARHRCHHGDLEQFGRRQRRQDGGQPRRQHGFAGAGRADQQQVMAAGRRHLERPLGALLALDVLQIHAGVVGRADFRLRARQQLRAAEMIGELDERARRDDLHLGAGPGGFRAAHRRADEALLARIGPDRGRQHARDRRDRAVEAELAQHGAARKRIGRDGADLGHQAERDRQIVMAAFLGQIGRRQVDGDAPRRQRQAGGHQRGPHPLLGLAHRLVGQPHHGEMRQAGRHLDLHVHGPGLDALERHSGDPLDHAPLPPLGATVAETAAREEHFGNDRLGSRPLSFVRPRSCQAIGVWNDQQAAALKPPGLLGGR